MDELHQAHFDEVACDQDAIPLAKNHLEYLRLADTGQLHVMTVRADGRIVGYIWGIIRPGLHNATSLMCYTDLYFLLPEFRKGRTGIDMFVAYEKTLRARGVKKVYTGTKIHNGLDRSKIFARLGWTQQEVLYCKVLL